jgi:hypothetical protein
VKTDQRFPRLTAAGKWAVEVADPLIAVVAGLGLAVAGLAGWIQEDALTATTLFVLSAVALSLLRERWLRTDANTKIDRLSLQQDETTAAVNAIGSGNPYSVLCQESTWDLATIDGSLVYATRKKEIRFDQNKVFAVCDFVQGAGSRTTTYSPGEAVAEFLAEGRPHTLVSLGRMHYRGERITLEAKRTVTDGFLAEHEIVGVEVEDDTELLKIEIKWPVERPPNAVRVARATPAREWRAEDAMEKVDTDSDGRRTFLMTVESPEKGSTTTVEWEW